MKSLALAWMLGILGCGAVFSDTWLPFYCSPAVMPPLTKALEAQGIFVLSPATAWVEVSNFNSEDRVPVAELSRRLIPEDPRWDPWLKIVKDWFYRSDPPQVVLWISDRQAPAAQALAAGRMVRGAPSDFSAQTVSPRFYLGWILVLFGLLYGGLRLWAEWGSPVVIRAKIVWLSTCGLVLLLGLFWILLPRGLGAGAESPGAANSALYLQHRWYQQALPYGYSWPKTDALPVVELTSYRQVSGKVIAEQRVIVRPDTAWRRQNLAIQEPHQFSRLFGFVGP